jgi:hypothetical protein
MTPRQFGLGVLAGMDVPHHPGRGLVDSGKRVPDLHTTEPAEADGTPLIRGARETEGRSNP